MITTTQEKAVNAYKTIDSLSDKNFSMANAYKLYSLKKKLQEKYDFQIEQEKNLVSIYNPTIGQNGSCTFDNQDNENEFKKKLKQLRGLTVEFDIDKIKLNEEANVHFTIAELQSIEDFIEIDCN